MSIMKQIIERLQISSGFNSGRCKHVALPTYINTRINTFRLFIASPIFIVFEDVSECFAYLLACSLTCSSVQSTHFGPNYHHYMVVQEFIIDEYLFEIDGDT